MFYASTTVNCFVSMMLEWKRKVRLLWMKAISSSGYLMGRGRASLRRRSGSEPVLWLLFPLSRSGVGWRVGGALALRLSPSSAAPQPCAPPRYTHALHRTATRVTRKRVARVTRVANVLLRRITATVRTGDVWRFIIYFKRCEVLSSTSSAIMRWFLRKALQKLVALTQISASFSVKINVIYPPSRRIRVKLNLRLVE